MENGEADDPPNEFKVVQMARVNTGVRVDLERVVVVCRVFEKTIEGVKHFVREKEKELPDKLLAICQLF